MTYKEALEAGYKVYTIRWTAGYVSRKADTDTLPVEYAPRKKMLYVDMPSWQSSRFCQRVYLKKEEQDD